MKLDNRDKIRKKKMIEISVFIGIFLILAVFTGFILNYAQKHSRDTIILSDIERLRYDLNLFYFKYYRFPVRILPKNFPKDKADCSFDLCLEYPPQDSINSLIAGYAPCRDTSYSNCGDNFDHAAGYRLTYSLSAPNAGIPAGTNYATPESICGDCGG